MVAVAGGAPEINGDMLLRNSKITAQKMKFSVKDFFSKCDQIRRKLRIWSHLLKKSLMENFIFSAVNLLSMFPEWLGKKKLFIVNLIFLIKPFFLHNQKVVTKL